MSGSSEFKQIIAKYLALDNQVKQCNKRTKEINDEIKRITQTKNEEKERIKETIKGIKAQMEVLQPTVMEQMEKNDLLVIKTRIGTINYKESKVSRRVTKEVIKERLEKIFENHDDKDKILELVFNTKEKQEKRCLKVVYDK